MSIPWVESTGTTARYRQLRDAVRMRYRQTTVSCIGCRPMRPVQMVERGIRGCGCVLKCLEPTTAWRRARTCAKAAGLRLSSPSWKLTSGWRLVRARIAPRHFRTLSAAAATE
jgi:hypothetical protein